MLQNLFWNQDKIIFILISLVVVTLGSALIIIAYREYKKNQPPVRKTEPAPTIVQPEIPPQVVYKEIVKPEIQKVYRTDSDGRYPVDIGVWEGIKFGLGFGFGLSIWGVIMFFVSAMFLGAILKGLTQNLHF